jgi:hypothetical protein
LNQVHEFPNSRQHPEQLINLVTRRTRLRTRTRWGSRGRFSDEAYVDAGAELGDPWSADVVVVTGVVPASR